MSLLNQAAKSLIHSLFRHYKGGVYRVRDVAIDSSTLPSEGKVWVLYQTVKTLDSKYNPVGRKWCRPLNEFLSRVHIDTGENTTTLVARFDLVRPRSKCNKKKTQKVEINTHTKISTPVQCGLSSGSIHSFCSVWRLVIQRALVIVILVTRALTLIGFVPPFGLILSSSRLT